MGCAIYLCRNCNHAWVHGDDKCPLCKSTDVETDWESADSELIETEEVLDEIYD